MKGGCELLMAVAPRYGQFPRLVFPSKSVLFSLASADVTDDCKRPRESEGKY